MGQNLLDLNADFVALFQYISALAPLTSAIHATIGKWKEIISVNIQKISFLSVQDQKLALLRLSTLRMEMNTHLVVNFVILQQLMLTITDLNQAC